MDPLLLLQYAPTLLDLINKVATAYHTSATSTTSRVTNVIQAVAPGLSPLFGQIGSMLFPNLPSGLHSAASAIVLTPSAVMYMQELLNAAGGFNLAVDGHFGPKTLAAVKSFQARHGLAVTGFLDDFETRLLQSLLPA